MIFRYELKKIFQKKVNLVAMFVGYVILLMTTISPVLSEAEYLYQEDRELKGVEAVQYHEEFAKGQSSELSEAYLTKVLTKLQESDVDPDTDEGYLVLDEKYGKLYHYLLNSFRPIGDNQYRPNLIFDLDLTNGAQFYERRIQRIKDFLNQDFSFGNYTEAEKEYWIHRAEAVKTPFLWGDTFGVKQYDTVIALAFYQLFVFAICLSPIFSSEHEKGTAGLLLSTKHGQRRMIYAKGLAAYCFGFSYLFIGYLISFLWLYFTIGLKGLDLPVQLLDSAICHSMNMGQFLLLQLLISVVVCFYGITLILFLSVLTKSTMGTMSLFLAGIIIPAFIPFSKESRLFNHILAPAVVRMMDLKQCMVTFLDYRIGPFILDLPTFSILIHIAVAIVLILFLRRTYIRRIK